MPQKKLENRQFRLMQPLQVRQAEENAESDFLVTGYAMKYDPYLFYENEEGKVYEEFKREAFKNADMSDIIMLYDHQGRVFARTSNGTLKVGFDDIGMWIKADLSSNQASRDLYEDIKKGLVTKMSWSFRFGEYHFDKSTRTIVHDSIKKVYDVSAVGIPANNDTNINARKFVDGVINEFETERFQEQEKRKKLQLKIKLEMETK
ncbi:HK97 family phage prohead protease [Helcococcus kunzii]|nr:HK97 family phage prohead protease [Helcococcus kunzii]